MVKILAVKQYYVESAAMADHMYKRAGGARLEDLHTADRQQKGLRRLQQTLNFQEPATPTFTVFSALHDSLRGEVKADATLLQCYPASMQLDRPLQLDRHLARGPANVAIDRCCAWRR